MTEAKNPFDYINSILENKKYQMLTPDDEKDYNPFLTNRALSFHIDTLLYANELNGYPGLDSKLQYDYLFHSIRKMRRKFSKWPKKLKDCNTELVMRYFQCNRRRAEEYLRILSKENLDEIIQAMDENGR